jgi:hypothetical protein
MGTSINNLPVYFVLISKKTVFIRNLKKLWHDLVSDDGIFDIKILNKKGNTVLRDMEKLGWIEIDKIDYKFTKLGCAMILQAAKSVSKKVELK